MDILHLDFETRSLVDLPKAGAYKYALDESTEVHCMAYAFNSEDVKLWVRGDKFPSEVIKHITWGLPLAGHNIGGFEILILNHNLSKLYDIPEVKIENCIDTMAMAYAMSLPGSLDGSSSAVGLRHQKDMKGRRVMLQLARPRSIKDDKPIWWEPESSPEKYKILYEYCIKDVEVERELHKRLVNLIEKEKKIWHLDWHINNRGVRVDKDSLKTSLKIIEKEKIRLDKIMKEVTGGEVETCSSVTALTNWLAWQGVDVNGVAKADVTNLLGKPLPKRCRQALELRQEASKTSTAKITAMLKGINEDDRLRFLFQYHGASTGRWAGRRVQLHNLPRPSLKQYRIEEAFEYLSRDSSVEEKIEDLHMFFGSPMNVISDLIRGFIIPNEGCDFIGCDFSSIEARVLAWLAGQEDILDVFRSHGKIYEHQASLIYKKKISQIKKDSLERQIGKVAVLALGYQGGVGAFQSMAKAYGLKIKDSDADNIKHAWRNVNTNIVSYWYDLENAAIKAVESPGQVVSAGHKKVFFKVKGSFLWCLLPSGRMLCYPYPRVEDFMTPWGETKRGLVYKSTVLGKWTDTKSYGGKLAENITQAVARDILAESMPRLESRGYNIVLHVHDECLVEVPKDFGSVKEVENIMTELPEWANEMPVEAEGWRGGRYRK